MHYYYPYYKKTTLLLLLKIQRTHAPYSKQILLCDAEKSRCLCAKTKSSPLHRWVAMSHARLRGGCHRPPVPPPSTRSLCVTGEGAFVSDFLASASRKGCWWKQKMLTHDGERGCGWEDHRGAGRKGWRLRARSARMEKQKSSACSWPFDYQ